MRKSKYTVFKYTTEDMQKIMKYSHVWKNKNLIGICNELLDHVYEIFEKRCYYCKYEIDKDISHVEHIVHKDKYVNFTYHPNNLTIACPVCNRIKGEKETLKPHLQNSPYQFNQYPSTGNDFDIIHAYYDEYEEYIQIEDSIFYTALQPKGQNTIRMCNLHRLNLAEKNIKKARKSNDAVGIIKKLTTLRGQEFRDLKEKILQELELTPEGNIENLIKITANKNFVDFTDRFTEKFFDEMIMLLDEQILLKLDEAMKDCILLGNNIKLMDFIERRVSVKQGVQMHIEPEEDLYAQCTELLVPNKKGIDKIFSSISLLVGVPRKTLDMLKGLEGNEYLGDRKIHIIISERPMLLEITKNLIDVLSDKKLSVIGEKLSNHDFRLFNESLSKIDKSYLRKTNNLIVLSQLENIIQRVFGKGYSVQDLKLFNKILNLSYKWYGF